MNSRMKKRDVGETLKRLAVFRLTININEYYPIIGRASLVYCLFVILSL